MKGSSDGSRRPGSSSEDTSPRNIAGVASPRIPDHELLRLIGRGNYGEVWLARNIMGAWRAVKIVYRHTFENDRPFEREFVGIQRYEPISRSRDGLVQVLHVGRVESSGCFFYVMELADDVATGRVIGPDNYKTKTIRSEITAQGATTTVCW